MTEPKFCRDCRHYRDITTCVVTYDHSPCLVTGIGDRRFGGNPYALRSTGGDCGPDGKLWEAKECPAAT